MQQHSTRPAAVAGMFYPAAAAELRATLRELLGAEPEVAPPPGATLKALVVPHAGYVYSGAVAARAYAELAPVRERVRKVVLLGPAHRVAVEGMALSSADVFATPLGEVDIDQELRNRSLTLPQVLVHDEAHAREHSLEVQLPFLQTVLDDFTLLPLVVGECGSSEVAELLDQVWGGEETLLVISTDLSHFHDYNTARGIDAGTMAEIESLSGTLQPHQACGCRPLNGLCLSARRHGLRIDTLAACNSGDTAGPHDRVVGYAAFALYRQTAPAGIHNHR